MVYPQTHHNPRKEEAPHRRESHIGPCKLTDDQSPHPKKERQRNEEEEAHVLYRPRVLHFGGALTRQLLEHLVLAHPPVVLELLPAASRVHG